MKAGRHLKGGLSGFTFVARTGVKLIDALLTRVYKIRVFSEAPECILRISHVCASRAVVLFDGTRVQPGDELIEIHFWNERLSTLRGKPAGLARREASAAASGLARGAGFINRLMVSLCLLAQWAEANPEAARFVAVHGTLGFIPAKQVEVLRGRARRLGFDLELREIPGRCFWTGAFWVQLWASWLMWAYNPASRRGKRLRDMALVDLWMSRQALLALRQGAASLAGSRPASC